MALSNEFEQLIDDVLVDGVISDTDRATLHKKALLEGVDPDEVEMIINNRTKKIQKEKEASKEKIRRCPSCHEIIPAMTAVCPSCGQVIDSAYGDNKALNEYIEKLESSLVGLKEKGVKKYNNKVKAELEGLIRQGKALYGDNKKINFLISEVESSMVSFDLAHKKHIKKKIIIIIVSIFAFCSFVTWCNYNEKQEMEERHASRHEAIEKARAQSQRLCDAIDALPRPNKQNYKDLEMEINKIKWVDIDSPFIDVNDDDSWGDECKPFKTYINKKRSYAKEIFSIYIELYGEKKAEKKAPDYIRESYYYIKN